ncbi:MAG TPA: CarD family transcriptional regulator, partial [Geminicoccaceae bacterium]|nr:CarD family transcriptional regulator [Geminicoccaceae bacterium]
MSDSTAPLTVDRPARPAAAAGRLLVTGAPEGLDALYLAERLERGKVPELLHVARDAARMTRLAGLMPFFAPRIEVVTFPAWDCLPYDRVSPNQDVVARRLEALSVLAGPAPGRPRLIVTTVNALVQKVPPPETIRAGLFSAAAGDRVERDGLLAHLERNGYVRTGTVVEAGEYAVRGGIVDVFPTGAEKPLRLDFFGRTLEAIRAFDPLTQRSLGRVERLDLKPVGEVLLDEAAIERFRIGYLQRFGAVTGDPLFESVTAGRKFPGMEHWLPLFHARLVGLLDYLDGDAPVSFDHLADEAFAARLETVGEHYQARLEPPEHARAMAAAPYRPLPPDMLYLDERALEAGFAGRERLLFSPFAPSPERDAPHVDLGGHPARDFAAERARRDVNLFDAIAAHVRSERTAGRRVLIAAPGEGALDRLRLVLADHGLETLRRVDRWAELARGEGPAIAVLDLDHGFLTEEVSVLAEQDLLGDRLTRPAARRARRTDRFINEVAALAEGDLVVHTDHGIGRFDGLVTLEVGGAPHDCLRLTYQGGDRLFVPVENLDVLSRYGAGAGEGEAQLDRLGGVGWQQRKARVKQRVREIAGELIEVAARRATRRAPVLNPPPGLYEEFAARFPYDETEDQLASIEDVLADLASGRPMDRLVCGDVGFGKTEVALRAAFVAAANGKQVALLAPTTLLARQHYHVFSERFAGLPIRVEQLSRFVTGKRANEVRRGIADGSVDVAIGTHALLGKGITFKDLGLVVIDEEQHFGVAHKERL